MTNCWRQNVDYYENDNFLEPSVLGPPTHTLRGHLLPGPYQFSRMKSQENPQEKHIFWNTPRKSSRTKAYSTRTKMLHEPYPVITTAIFFSHLWRRKKAENICEDHRPRSRSYKRQSFIIGLQNTSPTPKSCHCLHKPSIW